MKGQGRKKNVVDGNAHMQGAVIPSVGGEWEIFYPATEGVSPGIVGVLLLGVFKQRHC